MMRQAQRMQMQLNQAQAEVQQMTCEGSATPDDVDMLQDLVVAAVNDAMRSMNETAQAHIDAATGGMNLPLR